MKIKIFSHAIDLYNDTNIALEQAELLEKTGLLDKADEVHMLLHFSEQSFNWLKDRWSKRTNVIYHVFDESYKEWYEGTSIHYLKDNCDSTEQDFYALFITHKGISHPPGGHQNWRKYMQYWTIEKWKDCIQKLDEGYDTCGAAYLDERPYYKDTFYPGTFFWAKSSYLRRCKNILTPDKSHYLPQFDMSHHRFDYECWPGSGNPKWYEMHPGTIDRWYLPTETYREDVRKNLSDEIKDIIQKKIEKLTYNIEHTTKVDWSQYTKNEYVKNEFQPNSDIFVYRT